MKKETQIRKTGNGKNHATPSRKRSKPFPIVGIGASAGGLEAITTLLSGLPPDTGMAYVYIQHLDPTHESKLTEILSRHTAMKVQQASDRVPIRSNNLYIIPPNKDMAIVDGVIALKPRKAKPSLHLPVNKFFLSLAEKQKDGAIGILLSGNGSDGTLGLKAIKEAGGFTFAQDDSAKFPSMPKSAAAEGVVDMVLSPAKISEELTRLGSNKEIIKSMFPEAASTEEVTGEDLQIILTLLMNSTGVDFANYKVNTIRRRVVRRMLFHHFETLNEYLPYLKAHANEVRALYQDLLINVTTFFRDPDAIEYLKKTVLPAILKSKKAHEPVRIWVPACSSGEEAYSLAMVLEEILDNDMDAFPVQIFATDLSEPAIAKARLGLYSKMDFENVSAKRLQRFFTKVDHSYRIVKRIRDLCVFAPHNIFRNPPFSNLDLISCCNLMIYLETPLQRKILNTFHYALDDAGYLVLGKSEAVSSAAELFNQIEKKYKVYSKKNGFSGPAKFGVKFPLPERGNAAPKQPLQKENLWKDNELGPVVDDLLLKKFIPACVVVNEDLEILQFRGSTGHFLAPIPGKASLNLLRMVKPNLAFELRSAVHKTSKGSDHYKKSGIEVVYRKSVQIVSIEVFRLKMSIKEKLFLIVFDELSLATGSVVKSAGGEDRIKKRLEREIESLKEDMRSILEDKEAHLEELQSANEEVVSSNEELQSINEELETSKEEVESTNEELITINGELQVTNEQLEESNEYADSIFDTIGEAVMILDRQFRVKSTNNAFRRIFEVTRDETEGILIYDIGNRQWDIHRLRQLLEIIIPENKFVRGFEVEHEFPKIGHKVMLLNAKRISKNKDEYFILLAIEDITVHRQAQRMISERELWFRNMANQAPVLIWVAGADKRKNFFNDTWLDFTGRKLVDEQGFAWRNQIHPDDVVTHMKLYDDHFDQRTAFSCEYRLRRADGEYRWIFDVAKPTFAEDGSFTGFIGSCTEIHEKKLVHQELENRVFQRTADLQQLNMDLQRSNNDLQQFAYVASHDLQEPLRKILTFADQLTRLQLNMAPAALPLVEKIAESSKRMRNLIDDLLNFSRTAQAGKKFERVDLERLLQSLISDFDLVISEKQAQILHDKDLPVIEAIPLQMEQLFHNMLSNALKFSLPGVPPEVRITVNTPSMEKVRACDLPTDVSYFEICFTDNGIGFAQEYAEIIFDVFQRLNYKEDYPGTGIGLALCRRIVSNHRGKIFAEGVENLGTTFHIILPENQRE